MNTYKSDTEPLNKFSKIIRIKKIRVLFLYLIGVFINTIPILLSLSCSGDGCMVFYVSKILFLYWTVSYLLYFLIPAFNLDKKYIISVISFLPLVLYVLFLFIWFGLDSLFMILLFGTHNLLYAFIARYSMNK